MIKSKEGIEVIKDLCREGRGIDLFRKGNKITIEYVDDEWVKFVNTNVICQSISEKEVDNLFANTSTPWQWSDKI